MFLLLDQPECCCDSVVMSFVVVGSLQRKERFEKKQKQMQKDMDQFARQATELKSNNRIDEAKRVCFPIRGSSITRSL